MTISVALCTYNGCNYLSQQLESFLRQSRPPDELIVCDDNSQDNTAELIAEFAARAPFPVRLYINTANVGSTKNFEQAIHLCTGDLIALSDQDDVWLPSKLKASEETLALNPSVAAVFSDATIVDSHLRPQEHTLWQAIGFDAKLRSPFEGENLVRVLLRQNVVTGATLVFRSRFRNLFLPIPDYVVHDSWIALLLAMTAGIAHIDTPLILYRLHGKNQIGVQESDTLAKRLSAPTLSRRRAEFEPKLQRLIETHKRLTTSTFPVQNGNMLRLLEERILHFQRRLSLPANRIQRTIMVLTELVSGRYTAFSNGILSAGKDLLFP